MYEPLLMFIDLSDIEFNLNWKNNCGNGIAM